MAKKERKKETGSGDFENKEDDIYILIQLLKCFDLILKDLSSKIKRSRKLKQHNNQRGNQKRGSDA